MKKAFLFLFLVVPSFTAYCQNEMVLDSIYSYYWDKIANDWKINYRIVYKYDANGNQLDLIDYEWNERYNNFIPISRDGSSYDAYGNQTEWSKYDWDSVINIWIGKERYDEKFDEKGKRYSYCSL